MSNWRNHCGADCWSMIHDIYQEIAGTSEINRAIAHAKIALAKSKVELSKAERDLKIFVAIFKTNASARFGRGSTPEWKASSMALADPAYEVKCQQVEDAMFWVNVWEAVVELMIDLRDSKGE